MTNVPMARSGEALAVHDQQYGHSVTFAGLEGGRILLSTGRQQAEGLADLLVLRRR